jgi:methyl-accepting chemotaxis protein
VTVGKKLVLLTSGLGAALVALALLLVDQLFKQQVLDTARADIAAAGGPLKHAMGTSLEPYRTQARIVADDTLAKEALVRGAHDVAVTYVDSVKERVGTDYVILLDARGKVVADAQGRYRVGSELGLLDRPSADAEARVGFVSLGDKLVAAALVPVRLGERVLGALLLGDALTASRLVDAQRISQAGITLVPAAAGSAISTLPGAELSAVVNAAGSCAHQASEVHEVMIGDTSHLVATEPLSDVAGRPLGCMVLSRSLAPQLGQVRSMQRQLLMYGLLVTALAIAGGWFISSRVVRPIQSLTNVALRIARGDVSQPELASSGADEVSHMALAFNEMLRSLRALAEAAERMGRKDLTGRVELGGPVADAFNRMLQAQRHVVRQISQASLQLTDAGAKIHAASQQQESAATQQSAAVAEVSTTMQTLLASASHISASARGALENAERTKDMTDEAARQITELSGQSARIADLLEQIRGIASRSDILALNASLEATRAGEAGRGFGIVAGEMRGLAERVTGSVSHVNSLLGLIRTSGVRTVAATNEARSLAEDTTDSARRIASVTDEQRSATEQVLESMREISTVLGESLETARETRSTAEQLKSEANVLATLVGEFRVDVAHAER